MNQSDLIETVAAASGLTKNDASKVVHEVFQKIAVSLGTGDEVRIAGFGTFGVTERAEREGRNPQTGEAIKIAASKSAKFRPAKQLRDAVNG
ncbi:MAG TPA: HU family DNA-binding protein [Azospirillaceae bacterium]|nr:HU family DNA-binding protein [Azospirillaceae bacterium]